MTSRWASAFCLTSLLLAGCQAAIQDAYFDALESVGIKKRTILVDRVADAKASQQHAQQQFSSALEAFTSLIEFDGGELERTYESLNDHYQDSKSAAEAVTNRINKVESVAEALFREWEHELAQFHNQNLKQRSEQQYRDTRSRFNRLLSSLRGAEKAMQPALNAMQDNVLFLKHNLHASAIGALQGEFSTIRNTIGSLLTDMNHAIEQSDRFIASME
jgi:ElaB/YqjD/DUF883 family membrane-anchored ribosome-binding protein